MSIAGIDWNLADKIYAREEDKILENSKKRSQEIARDCREHGKAGTSLCVSEMHRAHIDMLSVLAEASINADWETVAVSQLRGQISEVIIDEIINRLKHRLSKHIRNFMQSAEASIQSNNIDPVILVSFRAKNEKTMGNLLGKEKRELDIRRGLMTIEEMKKRRFQFLHKLYEVTEADEWAHPLISEISEQLGFDMDMSQKIVTYLSGERLVERQSFGGDIRITHQGILEVEEALSDPSKSTEHFPPVNIYIGGNMISSQIQQASPGAKQTVTISESKCRELKEIMQSLKDSIGELQPQLVPEQISELQAEIYTIEAQMTSPRPKEGIVVESMRSIRGILESAAGSIVASKLLPAIMDFLRPFS